MAIDMGLSPHAIEKRLKMARAKLGVPSSLQAARMLAASEGYQHAGPQLSDLDEPPLYRKASNRRLLAFGATVMILAAILTFALLGGSDPDISYQALPKPGEIAISGPSTFSDLDKDRSGFLEGDEAPVLARIGGDPTYQRSPDGRVTYTGDYVMLADSKTLRDQFYREADADRDGKVSPEEFNRWSMPERGFGQGVSDKDGGKEASFRH